MVPYSAGDCAALVTLFTVPGSLLGGASTVPALGIVPAPPLPLAPSDVRTAPPPCPGRCVSAPGALGKLFSCLPLVPPIFRTFCSRIGDLLLFENGHCHTTLHYTLYYLLGT